MFHIGRDCAACQLSLFPTVIIESSLVKRQVREIQRALELLGIYNFAAIDKDNRDNSRDDLDLQPFCGQKSFFP